jgi:hypothetical protein
MDKQLFKPGDRVKRIILEDESSYSSSYKPNDFWVNLCKSRNKDPLDTFVVASSSDNSVYLKGFNGVFLEKFFVIEDKKPFSVKDYF